MGHRDVPDQQAVCFRHPRCDRLGPVEEALEVPVGEVHWIVVDIAHPTSDRDKCSEVIGAALPDGHLRGSRHRGRRSISADPGLVVGVEPVELGEEHIVTMGPWIGQGLGWVPTARWNGSETNAVRSRVPASSA